MKQGGKLFRFDLIRGIAMFMVIFTHFNEILVHQEIDSPYIVLHAGRNISISQLGVELFVLMSGILSVVSLQRCLPQDGRLEKTSVWTYYKKRFLAIMPMYYIAYVLAYIFKCVPDRMLVSKDLFWTFFGMDGYLSLSGVPTWYLVGEWFIGMIILCYLLCPFLYRVIKKYPKVTLCVLLVYYFLIVTYYPFARKKETDVLLRIFDFSLGMYFGLYVKRIPGIAAAICLGMIGIFWFVPMHFDYMFSSSIEGVLYLCLLWFIGDWLQERTEKPIRSFRNVMAVWARYSFAVYLIHMVVIMLALPPFQGESAGLLRYLFLLVYCGSIMAVLGVFLYGAEKHVMEIVKGFLAKRKEKKSQV